MTGINTGKATIEIGIPTQAQEIDETLRRELLSKNDDRTLPSLITTTISPDKTTISIEAEGMDTDELNQTLTALGFKLRRASTPTEKITAEMPTPTLGEKTEMVEVTTINWNIGECVDWVETVIAETEPKNRQQAYQQAVQQLIGALTITDDPSKRFPQNNIISSFHVAFAEEIYRREPHGVTAWKHAHGIEITPEEHPESV